MSHRAHDSERCLDSSEHDLEHEPIRDTASTL